jgi:hypothetical protein
MNIISHRGNLNGPIKDKENRPSYIDAAIQLGYDVEVDVRFINGEFWLGHDEPEYMVELSWMKPRKNKIWYHCKNQESSIKFLELNEEFKFFCHKEDSFVLTSNGYLWVHDLSKTINNKCVIPLISEEDIINYNNSNPGFVCTDFVKKINFE